MLEHHQTYRQILFDFTANYLEPLDGAYQRLAYISGLRQPSSGRYVHDQLQVVYTPEHVDQVLGRCHEEVFERLLEMPLTSQEQDLRQQLNSLPGPLAEKVKRCRESSRDWIPPNAPTYLKDLFVSNLEVLLELLPDDTTMARSDN